MNVNIKSLIISSLFSISISSCTEDFLDNARLGFEVNVVDENNVAIEDIEVNLFF